MATVDLFAVGQTIDQYKVVRLIADTQNSHTYLVEAPGIHKQLVLKLYAGNLLSSSVHQFVEQANLLLEFTQQPFIVNVMHSGYINERPFMVMPFYPQTLNHLLAVHYQKLSFLTSLAIIKQLIVAVQSLHHLRVVHLDIKPQNVFLDENNNISLADFDSANILESSPLYASYQKINCNHKIASFSVNNNEESHNNHAYTPEYASPELLNEMSEPCIIDESSDLYSIGALWFRILVGETFYQKLSNQHVEHDKKAFIVSLLSNVAPDWAIQLISDLLNSSALKRPSCSNCLLQIEHHVQSPQDSQTMHVTAIKMPESLSRLQQEIKRLLLVDGWLTQSERTRLIVSFPLLKAQSDTNKGSLTEQQLQDSLQQLIDDSERQLIKEKQLSAWFNWVRYLQVLLMKSGNGLSTQQYKRLLKVGRDSRPKEPALAEAVLKKHFTVKNSKSIIVNRYFLSLFLIVIVIFYWMFIAPDNSTQKNSIALNNEISTNKVVHTLTEQESSLIKENINKPDAIPTDLSSLSGSYEFDADLNKSDAKITVDWVRIQTLPNVRIMATEVTKELYSVCVKEGACKQTLQFSTKPTRNTNKKPSFDDGNSIKHPKVNVSWYDITGQFIPWLNQRSGKIFSLPNYQQWSLYSQSAMQNKSNATIVHCLNCTHSLVKHYASGTMSVASIDADSYGLYHILGNVQEWLNDCWKQQSIDGQHFERCDQAKVVGGSWINKKVDIQYKSVTRLLKTAKTPTTGFRLVELIDE